MLIHYPKRAMHFETYILGTEVAILLTILIMFIKSQ